MAARVTENEVKEVMDTELTASEIRPFITPANLMVTEVLSTSGLSAGMLKEIEKYIAAHFASAKDPAITEETVGDARAKYQAIDSQARGLETTRYGQVALSLDTTGSLAKVGKRNAKMELMN